MKTREAKPCEGQRNNKECKGKGTRKLHQCAFKVEISGDPEELCNCCSSCSGTCQEEV